ncbi:MAG: Glyoxalase/bleomycin resistance protein/dioxygenase [Gemmatimonadetes bacterium]|nr:Glyoxalase/bleomycin resistance protein/dioxygenase [Gemmatimonadota bacterium]
MISQLHSIAIFVSDIDRAIAFYRDTLGLPLVRQGSFGGEFLETAPHLGVHPAVHADAKKLIGRESGLTFHVPNLVHVAGVLHDRGVRFVREPTRMGFGVMAMIADPDGNVFALWDDETPDDEHAHG